MSPAFDLSDRTATATGDSGNTIGLNQLEREELIRYLVCTTVGYSSCKNIFLNANNMMTQKPIEYVPTDLLLQPDVATSRLARDGQIRGVREYVCVCFRILLIARCKRD